MQNNNHFDVLVLSHLNEYTQTLTKLNIKQRIECHFNSMAGKITLGKNCDNSWIMTIAYAW